MSFISLLGVALPGVEYGQFVQEITWLKVLIRSLSLELPKPRSKKKSTTSGARGNQHVKCNEAQGDCQVRSGSEGAEREVPTLVSAPVTLLT